MKIGKLEIALQGGTGRWAHTPRLWFGKWDRVGGRAAKLLTKWFCVWVSWNWREPCA